MNLDNRMIKLTSQFSGKDMKCWRDWVRGIIVWGLLGAVVFYWVVFMAANPLVPVGMLVVALIAAFFDPVGRRMADKRVDDILERWRRRT